MMVEFVTVGGKPLFINPALVEAVETATDGPVGNPRAGLKLASGKTFDVDGSPQEVVRRLFPMDTTVRRTGTLGI